MKNNEEMLKKFPTMKTQGAAKNEANNAAQAAGAAEAGATAGDNNGFFTPNEKIDFSKVKVEPLFEEQVAFETSRRHARRFVIDCDELNLSRLHNVATMAVYT